MRRAMAIQLIINREWGLGKNENPNQGSFIIEELTDLVEEAVLKEFEAISERGGVLGAMETGYQRGKIQEESLYYEHQKHDGSLSDRRRQHVPQSARRRGAAEARARSARPTRRSSRSSQRLARLPRSATRPRRRRRSQRLQQAVIDNGNVFAELMDAVRVCSLGQITHALFEVGGQYRRSM